MEYQFKYKGKTYECCGEDKDLQIRNFNHCIKTRDWGTMKNRIKNQLRWYPKDLVEIKERGIKITNGTFTPTIKPSRTETPDSDIKINRNGKQKTNFW